MGYDEAIRRFGSDKPDLRFGLELVDLGSLLKDTKFCVFANAINSGGAVVAINVPGAADSFTRKELDRLGEWIKDYGAEGLAWSKLNRDGSVSSSFEKFLSEDETKAIRKQVNFKSGDLLLAVASAPREKAFYSLGALRVEVAKRLNLIDDSEPNLLWVHNFPFFEFSEEEGRYVAKHHPFTEPQADSVQYLESEPKKVYANAYDLVLNGNEIGGGSIRIHKPDLQMRMLRALGFSEERAAKSFGFLIDALKYGAPPHGGFAFGLDRLLMLLLGCESIRETIAFPKVSSSAELMSGAPEEID
jgi:aspartyl-tRNA synthetase